MLNILSKIAAALFVLIVYYFIFMVVKMIYSDIRVMSRKKAGLPPHEAYLKTINQLYATGVPLKESYPLSEDNTLGRGHDCDIVLNDKFLSHHHSRIFCEKNVYYLEDLDSTNGTFLNGNALSDEAIELIDGDRIALGQAEFVFLRPEVKNGEVTL